MGTRQAPRRVAGVLGAILLGAASVGWAAGIALIEQGASGQGNAYAGGAAAAADASTIFFNPAGMSRLPGTQIDTTVHVIAPSAEFVNTGTSQATGAAIAGLNADDPSVYALVPNVFVTRQLSERVWVGLGVNTPFGLKTDYEFPWVGRYHGVTSALKTMNFNPSLAFKVSDRLTLGFGVSAMHADARLTQAIDSSSICIGFFGGAACAAAAGGALVTPASLATDGGLNLEADGWGYGFNAGLLFEPRPGTRIGAHYRSRMVHDLEGTADFDDTGGLNERFTVLAGAPGAFADQGITAQITFPETISVSGYHELSEQWALMGDVTFTRWSKLDRVPILFTGGQSANTLLLDWDNSWRYSLGAEFRPDGRNGKLTLRTGVAFDQAPTPSAELRSVRIPDADRLWLSFGLTLRHSDHVRLDAGYSHIFVGGVPIRNVNTLGQTLTGEYEASVDIVSVTATYAF